MVNISEDALIELLRHGVKGNAASFSLLARQLVSRVKKQNPQAAAKMADILAGDVGLRDYAPMAMPVDADSRKLLLKATPIPDIVDEPVWTDSIQKSLQQILIERREAASLMEAGLIPIKAVLFKGPPGVGKTLAAHWLARELGLPLLTLDLATVMSSLLGKTGSNIRSVIDYAKSFPCVLLLDEFDAVAKKRDDDRDVGELKRLVNVLLQAIDEWPSSSLMVAATNHPELLDSAVWRRFDLSLNFDNPTSDVIKRFLLIEGASNRVAEDVSGVLDGCSFAVLRRVISSSKKTAILNKSDFDSALIFSAMTFFPEKENEKDKLRNIQILQLYAQGLSQRKIAEQLGISHPTVGRVIREFSQER